MLRLRLLNLMVRKALASTDEGNTCADSRATFGGLPPETGITPMKDDIPMANEFIFIQASFPQSTSHEHHLPTQNLVWLSA